VKKTASKPAKKQPRSKSVVVDQQPTGLDSETVTETDNFSHKKMDEEVKPVKKSRGKS
jgi:hypothetical protein